MRRFAASMALVLVGCATASKDIATAYVSPVQYQSYDCEQLAAESSRIQARVGQLGGRLDQAAQNDATIGVVGALLFWPALFALGGTKQQEAEYARIKGEYDAIHQAAVIRKCPGVVPQSVATTAAPSVPAASAPVSAASSVVPPVAPASAPQ